MRNGSINATESLTAKISESRIRKRPFQIPEWKHRNVESCPKFRTLTGKEQRKHHLNKDVLFKDNLV